MAIDTSALPQYRCHKVVGAAKIVGIADGHAEHAGHRLDLETAASRAVSRVWRDKHKPKIGGYYIRYEDGYESYSPAEAFEAGYTLIEDGVGEAKVASQEKAGRVAKSLVKIAREACGCAGCSGRVPSDPRAMPLSAECCPREASCVAGVVVAELLDRAEWNS